MRVAIVGSRGYPSAYGGFETLVRRLAPYLVQHGHEVSVYSHGGLKRSTSYKMDGVQVILIPGLNSRSLATLSHGFAAALHASTKSFDVALVLNIANAFFLPILSRARIPSLVNVDGLEWERGKWGPVARAVYRIAARQTARLASGLISDSQEIRRIWANLYGVDSIYIPYGADVYDPGSERLDELDLIPESYVLVVARLVPENNVDLILDVIPKLGLKLVVVGSAVGRSKLEARLKKADDSRVTWLGHIADQALLAQLWANALVYVHGHSVGGTNPALLQALGFGAPVLALDTPFNREVLLVGENWRFFQATEESLARGVEEIATNAYLRSALRIDGQRTIAARYQWEDVLRRYERALLSHLDRGE